MNNIIYNNNSTVTTIILRCWASSCAIYGYATLMSGVLIESKYKLRPPRAHATTNGAAVEGAMQPRCCAALVEVKAQKTGRKRWQQAVCEPTIAVCLWLGHWINVFTTCRVPQCHLKKRGNTGT